MLRIFKMNAKPGCLRKEGSCGSDKQHIRLKVEVREDESIIGDGRHMEAAARSQLENRCEEEEEPKKKVDLRCVHKFSKHLKTIKNSSRNLNKSWTFNNKFDLFETIDAKTSTTDLSARENAEQNQKEREDALIVIKHQLEEVFQMKAMLEEQILCQGNLILALQDEVRVNHDKNRNLMINELKLTEELDQLGSIKLNMDCLQKDNYNQKKVIQEQAEQLQRIKDELESLKTRQPLCNNMEDVADKDLDINNLKSQLNQAMDKFLKLKQKICILKEKNIILNEELTLANLHLAQEYQKQCDLRSSYNEALSELQNQIDAQNLEIENLKDRLSGESKVAQDINWAIQEMLMNAGDGANAGTWKKAINQDLVQVQHKDNGKEENMELLLRSYFCETNYLAEEIKQLYKIIYCQAKEIYNLASCHEVYKDTDSEVLLEEITQLQNDMTNNSLKEKDSSMMSPDGEISRRIKKVRRQLLKKLTCVRYQREQLALKLNACKTDFANTQEEICQLRINMSNRNKQGIQQCMAREYDLSIAIFKHEMEWIKSSLQHEYLLNALRNLKKAMDFIEHNPK